MPEPPLIAAAANWNDSEGCRYRLEARHQGITQALERLGAALEPVIGISVTDVLAAGVDHYRRPLPVTFEVVPSGAARVQRIVIELSDPDSDGQSAHEQHLHGLIDGKLGQLLIVLGLMLNVAIGQGGALGAILAGSLPGSMRVIVALILVSLLLTLQGVQPRGFAWWPVIVWRAGCRAYKRMQYTRVDAARRRIFSGPPPRVLAAFHALPSGMPSGRTPERGRIITEHKILWAKLALLTVRAALVAVAVKALF